MKKFALSLYKGRKSIALFLVVGVCFAILENASRLDIVRATDHDYGYIVVLLRRWIGLRVDGTLVQVAYVSLFVGYLIGNYQKQSQEPD